MIECREANKAERREGYGLILEASVDEEPLCLARGAALSALAFWSRRKACGDVSAPERVEGARCRDGLRLGYGVTVCSCAEGMQGREPYAREAIALSPRFQ